MNLWDRIRTWFTDMKWVKFLEKWYYELWVQWHAVEEETNCNALYGMWETATSGAKAQIYHHMQELGCPQVTMIDKPWTVVPPAIDDPSKWLGDLLRGVTTNPVAAELAQTVGAAVYDTIMGLALGPGGGLPPELAERIRQFMGTVVMLTSGPRVVGTIAELITGGQVDTGGSILQDAYYNLGLGFITWQMTSPLIDSAIGQDLRRAANRSFRPTRFSMGQLSDLYAMGSVNSGRLQEELRDAGWRDKDIGKVIQLSYKPLTESHVLALRKLGRIGDGQAHKRLRILGYSDEDIPLIFTLEDFEEQEDAKGVLLSTARKAFKEGLISGQQFRDILREMGFRKAAIDLEIAVAKLQREQDSRSLAVGQIKAAYMRGIIGRPEAKTALQELDYDNESVGTILRTWTQEKKPSILKLNKSTITEAYIVGVLQRPEARDKLRALGYDPKDINTILQTVEAQGMEWRPRASIGLMIEAVKMDIITDDDLKMELIARGFDPFNRGVIVGLARRDEPERISMYFVQDAYAMGVIDRPTALTYLKSLNIATDDITLLLETADAERASRGTVLSVGFLLAALRDNLIGKSGFAQRMLDLNFTRRDIDLLVRAAEFEEPKVLDLGLVAQAFKEGVIGREQAMKQLVLLDYNPQDREVIIQTWEKEMVPILPTPKAPPGKKPLPVPPRPSIATLVAATNAGILTIPELESRLRLYGLAENDIQLYIAIATFEPPEKTRELTKTDILKAYEEFLISRALTIHRLVRMGYTIDDADMLLRLRRREPEDTQLHTLFIRGILPESYVNASFIEMGFSERQIKDYFSLYAPKE